MTKYADYNFYINNGVGSVPKADFNKLIIQASMKIKANTFGRVNENKPQEEVKLCACSLVDQMYEYSKNEGKQSETVGPHSVSYTNVAAIDKDKRYFNIIKEYLSEVYCTDGTPILYRGV